MADAGSSIPARLETQLCTSSPSTYDGDTWLHEIKYDGWRLLARKEGKAVRLFTRGGLEWSAKLPKLCAAIAALKPRSAWLDGELVYFDEQGYPRFESLGGAIRSADERRLLFQVFDLPWRNGRHLSASPLLERKARLARELNGDPRIRYTDHVIGDGDAFFRQADAMNLEGIVSKQIDSRYHAGERTRDWLKVKCWRRELFVVGGMERDTEGRLVSLLVGTPDGGRLRYEGRVEFALGRVASAWRDAPKASDCPFDRSFRSRSIVWLEPRTIIEAKALPRTAGARLRHGTAVRLAATL